MDDEVKTQTADLDECSYLPLRNALVNQDDSYLASCLAVTLSKLTIKAKRNLSLSFKQMSVDSILIICSLLKRKAKKASKANFADKDNLQRMKICLKILTQSKELKQLSDVQNVLVEFGRTIFAEFLKSHSKLLPSQQARKKQLDDQANLMITQPDEKIVFRQLKGKDKKVGDFDMTEEMGSGGVETSDFMSQIKNDIDQKIYQLTGYSDPIYAEAIAEVHHYDILLKIVLINRTQKTI